MYLRLGFRFRNPLWMQVMGRRGGFFFKQQELFVLKQTLWKTGSAVVAAGQSVRRPREGLGVGGNGQPGVRSQGSRKVGFRRVGLGE